jgi:hypothetical protein
VAVAGIGLVPLLGLGGAWYWARTRASAPEVEPPALVDGAPDPAPLPDGGSGGGGGSAPAAGESVAVSVTGATAQWVRLERSGATAADGRGSLTASVPAGDYDLAVKIVGRGAVRAPLSVPTGGITLACEQDTRGNLKCSGGKRPITLKP